MASDPWKEQKDVFVFDYCEIRAFSPGGTVCILCKKQEAEKHVPKCQNWYFGKDSFFHNKQHIQNQPNGEFWSGI